MSRLPRILPLTAIAVGGVLGVKALADVQALPEAMKGARAWAEEAVAAAKPAPKGKAADKIDLDKAGAEAKSASLPPSVAPGPTAVCAPSAAELAKAAGLSPAELQVLQSLGNRRGELDKREQDIDTQMALLAAAETKLDAKLKSLTALKGQMQALLGQVDKKQDEETMRLVSVYEKMKPRDAAAVMTALDDKVRIPVAAKMKDRALAAVLSAMPPAEAKKITESLAQRYAAVQAAAKAMNDPAPPAQVAEAPIKPADYEKEAAAEKPKQAAKARPRRPRAKPKAVANAAPKPAAPSTPAASPPAAQPAPAPPAA
jgi:flagellar motility protein MotE (MotC chaperone)